MLYKDKPNLTEAQKRGDEHDPYMPIRHICKASGLVMRDKQEGDAVTCPGCGKERKVKMLRPKENWRPHVPALDFHGRGVIAWTDEVDDMSDPKIVERVDALFYGNKEASDEYDS